MPETITEYADDIDLEQLEADSRPSQINALREIALVKRNGRVSLHLAWEPLSFKQEFDRNVYPDRADDFDHDYLLAVWNDRPMGASTAYGRVKAAIEELTGIKLTKNDAFRPQLIGKILQTTRAFEEYATKNRETGQPELDEAGNPVTRRNWFTLPTALLDTYTPPVDRKTVRIPRNRSNGPAAATISAEQTAALKRATNGKAESEYVNAILFGGEPLINVEPFVSEAADPPRLTERLVGLGAQVVSGKVFFAEA